MMEIDHDTRSEPVRHSFWEAAGRFDERFHWTTKQFVDFCVIVIVVSDAVQALNIIPYSSTIFACIDPIMFAHSEKSDSKIVTTANEVHFGIKLAF